MFLLWHPSLTAINLSYTFPILETSATALCGTTGNRVFHYFHHPFWGPTPIFGNIRMKNHFKQTKSKKNNTQHPFQPQTNQHLHASRFEDLPGRPPPFSCGRYGGMKKSIHTHFDVFKNRTSDQQVAPQFWRYLNHFVYQQRPFIAGHQDLSETWRTKEVILRDHFWSADSGWFLPKHSCRYLCIPPITSHFMWLASWWKQVH